MDRRRFVPSTEDLEGRQLQAALFGQHAQPAAAQATNTADTITMKQTRIEHLPFYLQSFDPQRSLPSVIITQLQADLNLLVAELHKSSPDALSAFNGAVRDTLPHTSLSSADAHGLNHTFGVALAHAGATSQEVASLQNDMNALAKVDANSSNSVLLATNDYSLVLQTALGVGQPIRTPAAPTLQAKELVKKVGVIEITRTNPPTLVGTYPVGPTMLIINAAGQVVG
jgi:hypothetical protein